MTSIHRFPRYSIIKSVAMLVIFLTITLAACGSKDQAYTPTPYRPPTLEAAATPLPTFPPESYLEQPPVITPSPTTPPDCQNSLKFIDDLTIPDGSLVAGGTTLDKRWLVQNAGTCNWNEHYQLKRIAGPELGATSEQRLYPARSGSEVMIRILFTTPSETGTYRSAWQAYDPEDRPFGDPFFIEVVVQP